MSVCWQNKIFPGISFENICDILENTDLVAAAKGNKMHYHQIIAESRKGLFLFTTLQLIMNSEACLCDRSKGRAKS
jgi:hypothetical protein